MFSEWYHDGMGSKIHSPLYSTTRWRRLRRKHLKMVKTRSGWQPTAFCVDCERAGVRTVANTLDHVESHEHDEALFWDESNLQPLCKPCHGAKSMMERHNLTYPDLSGVG